jgi:lipid A disaccharide synthetase
VAGKEVVKELLQQAVNGEQVSYELEQLIANEKNRARILAEYHQLYNTLDAGGSASMNTADLIVKYLNESN